MIKEERKVEKVYAKCQSHGVPSMKYNDKKRIDANFISKHLSLPSN